VCLYLCMRVFFCVCQSGEEAELLMIATKICNRGRRKEARQCLELSVRGQRTLGMNASCHTYE